MSSVNSSSISIVQIAGVLNERGIHHDCPVFEFESVG
jgi:hypothetical protein